MVLVSALDYHLRRSTLSSAAFKSLLAFSLSLPHVPFSLSSALSFYVSPPSCSLLSYIPLPPLSSPLLFILALTPRLSLSFFLILVPFLHPRFRSLSTPSRSFRLQPLSPLHLFFHASVFLLHTSPYLPLLSSLSFFFSFLLRPFPLTP